MSKRNIMVLVSLVVILSIILPLTFLSGKSDVNLDDLEKALLKECSELNLRKLEREDIINYFGVTISDDDELLFLTDFTDETKPFSPNILVAIVNNRNHREYYDALKSYIDMEIANTNDANRLKLYQNAIIKESRYYYYLIIGDNKEIIKVINNYYK